MELKRRSFLKTVASTAFAYLFLKNNGKAEPIPEIKPEEYHETFVKKSLPLQPSNLNGSGYYCTTGYFSGPPVSGYICMLPPFPPNRNLVV